METINWSKVSRHSRVSREVSEIRDIVTALQGMTVGELAQHHDALVAARRTLRAVANGESQR